MKNIFLSVLVFIILFGCEPSSKKVPSENVTYIRLTVDPNHKENRYNEKLITNKDSILSLINCINNKEEELWKFVTRYTIEINYIDKKMIYHGNNNHLMDETGKTYKLLDKDFFIYNY